MQPCPICCQFPCRCERPGQALACYISVAAVKQYMAIMGYEGMSDGPIFDAAAVELERLCEQSRLAKDIGDGKNETQQWRVKAYVRGTKTRLEFIVSCSARKEGDLPQLIAVRNKGA